MSVLRMSAPGLALAMLLGACGVPSDSKPRAIPEGNVPFELLAPSTSQAPTTVPVATLTASVYLVGANRLVAAERTVAAPLTLGSVLASLTQGATAEESGAGLRSAINPQTTVINAQLTDGAAVVNVTDAFAGIGLQEQIFALAQIVFTATSIEGVNTVQVLLNSTPVDVPRADGTLTRDPLSMADYATLAPAQ